MRRLVAVGLAVAVLVAGCGGRPLLQPPSSGPVEPGRVRITWFGQAMFLVQDSSTSLVVDPYGPDIGYIVPKLAADIVLISHGRFDQGNAASIKGSPRVVDSIGKSYIGRFSVLGVPSFHDATKGTKAGPNTIYYWEMGGMSFAHMGDFGQRRLTAQQLGLLRNVDVLMMPVGGGSTVNARTAAGITKLLGPKVVIPMHYRTPAVLVELAPVEAFTSRFIEIRHVGDSIEISPRDLPNQTEVWVMKYRQ